MTFTDNFGEFVAGQFSKTTIFMVDETGVSRQMESRGNAGLNKTINEVLNIYAQVGQGTTPATRADFNIEIPFSNGGVEDARVFSGNGAWNSGLGKITTPTLIAPTGGNGTITEVCLWAHMRCFDGVNRFFLLAREIISPTAFLTGQSINVAHEVLC